MAQNFSEIANFFCSVSDLLPRDCKPADFGKVVQASKLSALEFPL